jgi:hypothetical protein
MRGGEGKEYDGRGGISRGEEGRRGMLGKVRKAEMRRGREGEGS